MSEEIRTRNGFLRDVHAKVVKAPEHEEIRSTEGAKVKAEMERRDRAARAMTMARVAMSSPYGDVKPIGRGEPERWD